MDVSVSENHFLSMGGEVQFDPPLILEQEIAGKTTWDRMAGTYTTAKGHTRRKQITGVKYGATYNVLTGDLRLSSDYIVAYNLLKSGDVGSRVRIWNADINSAEVREQLRSSRDRALAHFEEAVKTLDTKGLS